MTKDLLTLYDLSPGNIEDLFMQADRLRKDLSARPLEGRTVALIFQKPSLRTRVSFEVGVTQLGGHTTFLSQESIGVGTRESAHDVAMLLSRYCDALVARLYDHSVIEELARYASIPVINALTDRSHPCQVLADAYTLRQNGRLVPGVHVTFVGDGNNVVNSWLELCCLFPLHFTVAAPAGYWPEESMVKRVRDAGVGSVDITDDPVAAVKNADVVYTDVWTSMGQESEAEMRKAAFAGFQVNEALMRNAPPDCLVMHCLPAHRGEEISAGVIDGPQSIVFDEAENRLHIQKAVLSFLCAPEASRVRANTRISVQ